MNGLEAPLSQISSGANSSPEFNINLNEAFSSATKTLIRLLNTTVSNSTSNTTGTNTTSNTSIPMPTIDPSTIATVSDLATAGQGSGYEKIQPVHIANFSQFFKISAFFIAFVLFYAITVPLIMKFLNNSWQVIGGCVKKLREKNYSVKSVNLITLVWIFYVILTPMICLLIWGILLAKDPAFSTQFGLGITLIGHFVLFVFLGFCDWKGHDWYLSKLSIIMFIGATISAFMYCFLVIFLPQYFTYNGTTAIFMALNFIFASSLTYLKTGGSTTATNDRERFIKLDILVRSIVEMGSFNPDVQGLEQRKLKLKTVMQEAQQINKRFFLFTKIIAIVLYICTFAAYVIVIIVKNPTEYKLVGLMHVLLLLTSDQVIYWLDNERGIFQVRDWFKCLYQFVMRFMCCFLLDYWLSMESLCFFITIMIVSANLAEKLIPRPPQSPSNHFHIMCYQNPLFQAFVEQQLPDVACPQGPPEAMIALNRTIPQKIMYYLGEMFFFIHLCLFIAIAAGSAKSKGSIMAKEFAFENTFHQWVIALFSLIFGVLCGLIYAWFRYFQSKKYVSDWKLYLSFALIEGASIALGFVFFGLLNVKVHLIWTSFAILPAVLGSFLLFLGHWISNDYFFYEKTTGQQQDPNAAPAQVNVKDRLLQIDREAFCNDFKQLISCGYLPKGKSDKDKGTFAAVVLNIALIILYTILTSSIFNPWWVGFTIGFWIAIAQLTFVIFMKFYQTYYQMNFFVQFSLLLLICLYIIWTVVMGIYVFAYNSHMTVALVAFCLASSGYVFICGLILGALKLLAIPDNSSLPVGLKILFSFSFLLIGGIGAAIIALAPSGAVWGHTLCGVCVYLIVLLNVETRRIIVSIVFAVVLVGYAIFVIIFYNNSASTVLQALSVILIVVFLFFGLNFLRKWYENGKLQDKQIFVYSKTLFPTMKYLYSEQKMLSSNQELVFFCLTAFTFFVWSFLAGILLSLESRYIGISFTAITISVIYVYLSDRLKKASFLEADHFKTASLHFFTSSIAHALELKQQWRMDFMQQKALKVMGGGSQNQAITLPSQDVVEKELKYQEQWEELYKVQSLELDNKLARIMYFSFKGKERNLAVQFNDQRASDLEQQMKQSDTSEKQIDTVIQTTSIMQKEKLFDVEFYAFLNAYLYLKMRNLEDDLRHAMDKWKADQIAKQNQPDPVPGQNTEGTVTPSGIPIGFNDGGIVPTGPSAQVVPGESQEQKQERLAREEAQRRQLEEEMRRLQEQEAERQRRQAEEKARQEEEHRKRQQAFLEEEAQRKAQEQANQQNMMGDVANVIGGIMVKDKSADELYLIQEGDRLYQQLAGQIFSDNVFGAKKALGNNEQKLSWARIKDIDNQPGKAGQSVSQIKIFDEGVSAVDIKQGTLGDCYLLSAMSVIAHSRPDLIQKLFHPNSRVYNESGLYTLMFFRNRKPVVISIDDYFPTDRHNQHAYVQIGVGPDGTKECWPMLIEKAYAKMYGSYPTIEGGLVDEALADLTNGAPYRYDLTDPEVKKMYNSGEFWEKLVFWSSKNYLMGAGSPAGSDADVSPLGIVQGHAYSILDVCEVEGTKLIQLRNPWGEETEWKGAWGDNSKEWTERRRRIVYDRMQQKGYQMTEIGKSDGVFWMSVSDFFKNFEQLFLCRFFGEEYVEINYQNEWSRAKGTAGGCCNYNSVGQNPQLQMKVTGNGPVEIFCFLLVEQKVGQEDNENLGIGFQIYDYKGQKIKDRRMPNPVLENHRGYMVARSVSLDSKINPNPTNPYTLLITTFENNQEAKFTFTMWYNKTQGKVELTEFP